MKWIRQQPARIRLITLAMLAAFGLLGGVLWKMQVARSQTYRQDLEKQSVRRVRIPGLRGRILDRHGQVLADNRPSYCIAFFLEELRQPGGTGNTIDHVESLVNDLAEVLGVEPDVDREDIQNHFRRRLPLPLLAWRDVSPQVFARWAEQATEIPGVDVFPRATRVYPHGKSAAHVLGYVGRTDLAAEESEPYHYYLPDMSGKTGVEKTMDHVLRGEAGGRLVRVDVTGFRREDPHLASMVRAPAPGRDIRLTIDLGIQQSAERALAGEHGAVVIMDAQNGDLLAMASAPAFDPNAFVPTISSRRWEALRKNPAKPLFNRAASGTYAPGSTFKPVVAIAALANGKATLEETVHCRGSFSLGRFTFRCAHVHGDIGFQDSITRSCNVFYYRLGLQTGWAPIAHMASALGLGRKTGIALDHEKAGLLPDDAWMRRTFGHGWRAGDTVNGSIGQGALAVTPLQMAAVVAAFANGGTAIKPRLLQAVEADAGRGFVPRPREPGRPMNWREEHIGMIRRGMLGTIMGDHGTARGARVEGVRMAGKTGTAEYGRKEERKYRGWMIVFAPYERPRYAIAVVVDDAVSGGTSAGPIIHDIVGDLLGPGGGRG